jgi:FkbM family methyltransferase
MFKFLSLAKRKIVRFIASLAQDYLPLEKLLCHLCKNSFFRKTLKLEAIAYAYLTNLQQPELRLANLKGYPIWVNIAEYQGLFLYFFQDFLEPWSSFITETLINPGDTCVDIGANMGSYTFLMASQASPSGRIYAFEPLQNLYHNLLNSVKLNALEDTIVVENYSVHSCSQEVLKIYVSTDARNSGISSKICYGDFLNEQNFIESSTIAFADYGQANAIDHCHFVKIDVEGSELEVIRGMSDCLANQKVDYLLVEQAAGSETQKILNQFGYQHWFIDENKCLLLHQDRVAERQFGNYLFVSPNCFQIFQKNYIPYFETAAIPYG